MEKITVLEKGQKLEFSFEDLLKYHGVGYPGGVAHAFQVCLLYTSPSPRDA